ASGNSYQTVTFHAPQIGSASPVTLTSAASNLPSPVAPGSLASAWGSQLAGSSGASVTVTDQAGTARQAAGSYASPSQVNFRIPPGTAAGDATIAITSGGTVTTVPARIAAVAPGIFQLNSTALAAALVVRVKADQSQSFENVYQLGAGNTVAPSPIDLGTGTVYLSLFATGLQSAQSAAVTVGGQNIPVLYTGAQGTYDGLDQINAGPVPRSLAGSGRVTVVVTAGGQTANPVELAIK
ncbi:MAG TPA: hypothetical protein VMJ75_15705, partial [Candidatus Acidoferrales bacterium]|nr:hypothetical protein [Candidatus Acidoferrales bacterium]